MRRNSTMRYSNQRPFTTPGSRSQFTTEASDNRPKTAFPSHNETKLPKLKSESNFEGRKTLVNNDVASHSKVNGTAFVDDENKSSASSPRHVLSRKNSKKGLLKRSKGWRHGSVSADDIGMEDSVSFSNLVSPRSMSAWDEFENHIRQVNDTPLLMEFDEKTLDFKCSDTFKRIMNEIGPKKVKTIEKRMSVSSLGRRRSTIIDEADEKDASEEEDDEDYEDDDDYFSEDSDPTKRRRRPALRAWGLMRRHIQEVRVEKRMATGSINWDFLRQTITALSDMEKARQELYEKYIYKPNWWADGLSRCPEHLIRKYQNRGPLLPPVVDSNSDVDSKGTKEARQSRQGTSQRKSAQSVRGSKRQRPPTSKVKHPRSPLKRSWEQIKPGYFRLERIKYPIEGICYLLWSKLYLSLKLL